MIGPVASYVRKVGCRRSPTLKMLRIQAVKQVSLISPFLTVVKTLHNSLV
jgi:hypothetical protein